MHETYELATPLPPLQEGKPGAGGKAELVFSSGGNDKPTGKAVYFVRSQGDNAVDPDKVSRAAGRAD